MVSKNPIPSQTGLATMKYGIFLYWQERSPTSGRFTDIYLHIWVDIDMLSDK
jgi:hypothetical protein